MSNVFKECLFDLNRFMISSLITQKNSKFTPEEILNQVKKYNNDIEKEDIIEVADDFVKEDILVRKGDYYDKLK